ncbi:hypothetical protein SAY86_010069 [Trapa natans]|uniref:VAN3-binding protein n=1 Tax=Trapa natans TaxID=22666 RepID=A0AAN7KZN0_TRANT|nr:hypothetical protein SAY86_010069 [Trapa natans]
MDSSLKAAPTHAHPETMDLLSRAWCNFALHQAYQPEVAHDDRSIVLLDPPPVKRLGSEHSSPTHFMMEKSLKIDSTADFSSLPTWKTNDVKSWIWMQQAMHPELNYKSCFRKKWVPWNKIAPFKIASIKKWLKEVKQRRKEEGRLQRAEVHAAISVAGVAAALAAIAAENTQSRHLATTKEAAVASAAALVAAQCAQVAEAMGAKREQLKSAINSAMSSTATGDILTLTAAASTSLRGAEILKARTGCTNKFNGEAPVLPIEDSGDRMDNVVHDNNSCRFDFDKCRSLLARGTSLTIETPDGRYVVRSVSIAMNNDGKVILRTRKLNLLRSKKESIVRDLHAELYKDSDVDGEHDNVAGTCYLIVLSTNSGTVKLDMSDDYKKYRTWATTINHMLALSSSTTSSSRHTN